MGVSLVFGKGGRDKIVAELDARDGWSWNLRGWISKGAERFNKLAIRGSRKIGSDFFGGKRFRLHEIVFPRS